jgi:hypothetical protein
MIVARDDGSVAALLRVSRPTVGYREGSHNANRFSAELGRPGEAWCADWLEWCLRRAGVPEVLASAYCPTILNDYAQRRRVVSSPAVGDQFFVMKRGVAIHTGFVTGVNLLWVNTREGNTNIDGSANGIGVFDRKRFRAGLKFGRPAFRVPSPPAPHQPAPTISLLGKKADMILVFIKGCRDVYLVSARGVVHVRNPADLAKLRAGLPSVVMSTPEEVVYYFGGLPNKPTVA